MKVFLSQAVLELVQGDITHQEVDAIVNAANQWLAGGGGVDGAIHDAGGPAIMQELKRKYAAGCSTGDAVATGAGKLRAKYVMHAVGPVYYPNQQERCAQQLRQAYWNSFRLAAEQGCRSIALPSISTGVFHYPIADAARIALRTARDFLEAGSPIKLARWVLCDERTYEAFTAATKEVFSDLWPQEQEPDQEPEED
jgi:O-acetyl-ADP-ribose deacetylase (regulator of RNase III)